MKKITALFLVCSVLSFTASSQANITSISYNKTSQPGLILELPYNQDVSESFIVDNLKKIGYDAETKGKLFWKQDKLNGFYVFKDVRLEGLPQPVDLYFKVERKSKKQKDQSMIYMLVSKGNENFASSVDEPIYFASKKFLNGFTFQSAVYKLDLDIKAQEENLKDAEKKLVKLQDNEKDMTKKIEQLQKDLVKNKEDQEEQKKNIDNERKKLEDLRMQTKNN